MIIFWKSAYGIALILFPFFIALLGVAIDLHIAGSRHFQILLHSLKRSPALCIYLRLWGTRGLAARIRVVASMSGVLACPSYAIRRGALDAEDLRTFPPYLARRIRIATWLTVVGTLWLFIALLLLRLAREQA